MAVRGLVRRPGFSAITVATLALGIGATATILSVVDGVMLRPLPYDDPEELVAVGVTFPEREWVEGVADLQYLAGVSHGNFADLRDRSRTLDGLAGVQVASALLPDRGEGPEMVPMARVTEDFFATLRIEAERGRLFSPAEHTDGADQPPVVITWAAWQNRFGADADVVGRALPAPEGLAAPTIVGVLPRDFVPPENLGLTRVEFWEPLEADHPRYADRGSRSLSLLARLADGATVEEARAELTDLAAQLAREYPDGNVYPDGRWFGYGVNLLQDDWVGTARRPLAIFLGAALLLLAIATLNTANLLLVRGMDRTGELSVRRALGAGRRALLGQLLLESVVLALLGGALGVLLANGGVAAFLALAPEIPRMEAIRVDGRILGLTAAIAVGTGILAGLAPGLGVGRRALATGIRRSTPGAGGGSSRLHNALVAGQLAMALVLTVGGSVLMHSFVKVTSVDPGVDVRGVSTFQLAAKRPGADARSWVTWDETLEAVRRVPGIQAAAGTSNLPFEDPNWAPGIRFPGETEAEVRSGNAGYAVTPGYFDAMGQAIVAGRGIERLDGPDAEAVAVVNEELVRRYFDGRDPLDALLLVGGAEPTTVRVVGVVANVVVRRAEEGPSPALYMPYTQVDWPWVKVVARSPRPTAEVLPDLRRAAAIVSPIVPAQNLRALADRVRSVETEPRFQAFLITSFALAALLLAAVGLYGSLAWTVGRRRREMGIRMALGAEPGRVFHLVLGQGLTVAGAGLALGLVAAGALGRVLERFLFDVPALDPVGFAVATGILLVAVGLAVMRPARRAARVDLVDALRAE
jgi:predicted permease